MAQRKMTSAIRMICVAFTAMLALPNAVMAQDRLLFIPRERADCLINIVELDKRLTTDPVLLKLDNCPDIVARVDDLKSTQLAASPGSPTPRIGQGLPILILTKHEVACLLDQLKLDRDTNGGSDPVRIDLGQCSAS